MLWLLLRYDNIICFSDDLQSSDVISFLPICLHQVYLQYICGKLHQYSKSFWWMNKIQSLPTMQVLLQKYECAYNSFEEGVHWWMWCLCLVHCALLCLYNTYTSMYSMCISRSHNTRLVLCQRAHEMSGGNVCNNKIMSEQNICHSIKSFAALADKKNCSNMGTQICQWYLGQIGCQC
jgi:hypothetical protein